MFVSQLSKRRHFLSRLSELGVFGTILFWAALLLFSSESSAITYYSRATGSWNTNSTWSTVGFTSATNTGSFPIAGDVVNIGGGFIVTVSANAACASITYEAANRSNTVTINSGISLIVSGTITIPRASGGGTANINLMAVGAGTLNAATIAFTSTGKSSRHRLTLSTGTINVTGNITTNNSNRTGAWIQFTGSGTLNIGGSLFSGGGGTLTQSTGTVNYNGTGAQTIASFTYYNLTVTNNSTKSLRAATNVSNTLTVNSGSTLALSTFTLGATTRPASTVMYCASSVGSFISGTGTFSLGGNVSVLSAGTGNIGATISCPVSLIATRTFTVADDLTTAKDLTISGIVSGAGFGVVKNGAGAMELSGLNTYTGTTTISSGIVRATNNTVVASTNGPLGNNANGLLLAGGTLQSNVATFSRPITVTVTNSTIDAYGSARTVSSAITLATAGTFNLNIGGVFVAAAEGQALTLSGIISNSSGTLSLLKIGSSTATLSATNTFTGTVTISGGTLIAGANVAVSTNGPFGNSATAITLGDASTTSNNYSPSLQTGGAFTISRAVTIANQATSGVYSLGGNTANTSVFSGAITMNQPLSITQATGGTVQISGTLTTGANKVTKIGAGTFQRTTSALAFGGDFEVNAGTFNANALATTVTGLCTVSGGTYTASTAAQTFNGGLTISGGTYTGLSGTAGNTATTNLSMSSGSLSAPGSTGTFTVSGNWSITGGTFTHNSGTVVFNGSTQSLGGSVTSAFNNLTINNGSTTTLGINATIASGLTVNGTYDLATFTSNRTANGGILSVSGTLRLGGTSGGQTGSNFPTNFVTLTLTGSTVNYYRSNGGQTVYSTPVYVTLTVGNTSGTQTAGGNLVCTTLNTTFGGTLDMVTNTLTVSGSPNNLGTIATQNTGATPLSTGKSWGGTINYNAGGNQSVVSGGYTNLQLSISGNKTFLAALTIFANLSISGTAKAALGTFTSSANTLSLAGAGQANGSWGSTASPATNKNNTWFLSPNTGIINIAASGCTNSTASVLSGTASICNGSSTNLSVTITGGTSPFSVVYTDGVTPVTVNGYTSGAAISVSPSSTKTYSLVSVTGVGGCVGTGLSGTPTVTVNNGSTSSTLSGTTTICFGQSANLSISITGGTSPFSVVYTDGTTPATVNGYVSGSAIPVSPSSTKTYNLVSVTSTGGCSGSGLSGTPTVTVNPLPVANAGGDAVACSVNSYTFSAASALNASSVLWTTAGDGTFNNATLLASTYTFGPNDLIAGVVSITLTANGISPCGTSGSTINLRKSFNGTWLGTVSSNWGTASNWCGGVPTSGTAVVIPSGTPFSPVISSGSQSALSVSIAASADLTVSGGSLTLSGNLANSGTLDIAAGGSIDMAGNQVTGSGDVIVDGTFNTSRSNGFSGSTTTAIHSSVGSLSLGSNSTIDYSSSGSQIITIENYANLTNSGNGNRTLDPSGTIGISGNLNSGSGTYIVTGSSVKLNGLLPQTLPGLGSSGNYNNLIIDNSSGVTLTSNAGIIDSLTIVDGDFNTNAFDFTLISTASKTGRIAPITTGSVSGDVVVQRFVPGGVAGWATICAPVAGATLAQWNDDIATSGFVGSTYGPGIFNSIYTYNESIPGPSDTAHAYIQATNVTNSIDPLKGYWVFIDMAGPTVGNKLLDVKGPILSDDQDLDVTFTSSYAGLTHDGWNLVANPYPSAIDWNSGAWTKNQIDNGIYIYDTETAQYVGTVGGVNFNGGSNIIASSQAFLIHANAAAPVLIASEAVKTSSNPPFFKSTSNTDGALHIQLEGPNGAYRDESVFRMTYGASQDFDPSFDAYKLYSFDPLAPNICTKLNGIEYAVNTMDELQSNFDLPIRVNAPSAGNYSINLKGLQHFSTIPCLRLKDNLTNTTIDLKIDSSYSFYSALDTASAYARFTLHFGVENPVPQFTSNSNQLSIPSNATLILTNLSTGASSFVWNFGDGSPLDSSLQPNHTYTQAGSYTLSLQAISNAGCSAVSSTLIEVDDLTSLTSSVLDSKDILYVSGDVLNIELSAQKGKVKSMRLFDSSGKLVLKQDEIKERQFSFKLSHLPKGIYNLELQTEKGNYTKKFSY